jgi:hypothetical protein
VDCSLLNALRASLWVGTENVAHVRSVEWFLMRRGRPPRYHFESWVKRRTFFSVSGVNLSFVPTPRRARTAFVSVCGTAISICV